MSEKHESATAGARTLAREQVVDGTRLVMQWWDGPGPPFCVAWPTEHGQDRCIPFHLMMTFEECELLTRGELTDREQAHVLLNDVMQCILVSAGLAYDSGREWASKAANAVRQLAEVTAERDALKRRVEELEAEVRSLKTYDHFADL